MMATLGPVRVASLERPANDTVVNIPANDARPIDRPECEAACNRERIDGAPVARMPPEVSRRFVAALADLLVVDLTRRRL